MFKCELVLSLPKSSRSRLHGVAPAYPYHCCGRVSPTVLFVLSSIPNGSGSVSTRHFGHIPDSAFFQVLNGFRNRGVLEARINISHHTRCGRDVHCRWWPPTDGLLCGRYVLPSEKLEHGGARAAQGEVGRACAFNCRPTQGVLS